MKRRRFTPEYKQEALQLAQQSDIPICQVAQNLGINDNVLRRWIKEFTDPSYEAVHGSWKSTRRGDGRREEGVPAS